MPGSSGSLNSQTGPQTSRHLSTLCLFDFPPITLRFLASLSIPERQLSLQSLEQLLTGFSPPSSQHFKGKCLSQDRGREHLPAVSTLTGVPGLARILEESERRLLSGVWFNLLSVESSLFGGTKSQWAYLFSFCLH